MANNLNLDGTTNYIKRILIPKPGTEEKRPLGIPTLIDRAKQCLCKLILEPEAEAKFESNSFGFRPGRSAIDAVSKIRAHLIFKGPCYVLDTDIRKCFDRINHQNLRAKIGAMPIIDSQIDAWLKAGIFTKNEVIFPTEGTPQGGIISPLLANIAIDGLQHNLANEITKKFGKTSSMQVYYIRYADDFVVMAPSKEIIEQVKLICASWLSTMNLEMKSEVTRIIYTLKELSPNKFISEYFDFLGFRFKQRQLSKHVKWSEGGKTSRTRTFVLINPNRIERHKGSITSLLKKIGNVQTLIKTLNPRIIGWCNYFMHSDAKEYGDLPRKMDLWLNAKVRKWIKRSTKLRGKHKQFWKQDTKDWILYHIDDEGNEVTLKKYNSFKWSIYDYRAINSEASPYKLDYKTYKKLS
jgi:RNA-directed DNA polymerase